MGYFFDYKYFMSLTLLTSGTTKAPKQITHSWNYIDQCVQRSIEEIGLTATDIVLDVFPANTIAHYTVTAMPAFRSNAQFISAKFEATEYIKMFNQYRPTYIALIPRHWELLKQSPLWANWDMSSVRYMVTGSGPVYQLMIDDFISKGVKVVANWYGMTEQPPPVLVGYNSEEFDFNPKPGYAVEFADDGECVINGFATGDVFDVTERKFLCRKATSISSTTWKNL
jgi:long-subunit acyl-CoA synthetase (AMP-forming)